MTTGRRVPSPACLVFQKGAREKVHEGLFRRSRPLDHVRTRVDRSIGRGRSVSSIDRCHRSIGVIDRSIGGIDRGDGRSTDSGSTDRRHTTTDVRRLAGAMMTTTRTQCAMAPVVRPRATRRVTIRGTRARDDDDDGEKARRLEWMNGWMISLERRLATSGGRREIWMDDRMHARVGVRDARARVSCAR